ncbi:MAG: hypothetical protein ACRDRJ_04620 [Streptosporangiaceae bacterium]
MQVISSMRFSALSLCCFAVTPPTVETSSVGVEVTVDQVDPGLSLPGQ